MLYVYNYVFYTYSDSISLKSKDYKRNSFAEFG